MAATEHSQNIKKDTKEWITIALLDLLQLKKLSKLTVAEVVKKAGVSRMAFYRNYESLEQVLMEYYEPKFADIFGKIANQPSHEQKLADMGLFFLGLEKDFMVALDSEYTDLLYQISKKYITGFYDELNPFPDWSGIRRTYWINFISAGVFEIWMTWFRGGQKESLEEISGLIREFQP